MADQPFTTTEADIVKAHVLSVSYDAWDTFIAILDKVVAEHKLVVHTEGTKYEALEVDYDRGLFAQPLADDTSKVGEPVWLSSDMLKAVHIP